MLADYVGQKFEQGSMWYLISDPPCLGPQLEDSKVGGWNHLWAHSLICQFIVAGCLSGALGSLCGFSSCFSLNVRYGGCFKGESLRGEGTRQKLYPLYGSVLEITNIHLPCSIGWCTTSPPSPHFQEVERDSPLPQLVRRMLITL